MDKGLGETTKTEGGWGEAGRPVGRGGMLGLGILFCRWGAHHRFKEENSVT